MRLELSRRPQADLDDIRDYGAERFGPEQAIVYLDGVEQVFRRVLASPEIGPPFGDRGTRSYPVGEHRVYYEQEGGQIVVLRVLHKRMDVVRHL